MSNSDIEKYHFLENEPEKLQFDIFDLSEYHQQFSDGSSSAHTHSFYQIIWFKNKTGKHYIDFEEFDINKDRLFFIAKNQVHYFEKRDDYEGYLLHFNESFILSNEADINFFLTYSIFNNKKEPFFDIPEEMQHLLSPFISQMTSELENKGEFGNKRILSNLLKSLLLIIEREKRKSISTISSTVMTNSNYLNFRNLLENNFTENWSVANYADKLAVSTKTLNALIKKESGNTVSQTIANRVILEAKRKLTHTNAYINDIALDLGFQDPYYFIRYFKKHVHLSPTQFRKSIS